MTFWWFFFWAEILVDGSFHLIASSFWIIHRDAILTLNLCKCCRDRLQVQTDQPSLLPWVLVQQQRHPPLPKAVTAAASAAIIAWAPWTDWPHHAHVHLTARPTPQRHAAYCLLCLHIWGHRYIPHHPCIELVFTIQGLVACTELQASKTFAFC